MVASNHGLDGQGRFDAASSLIGAPAQSAGARWGVGGTKGLLDAPHVAVT
jgi:hypothetical protein